MHSIICSINLKQYLCYKYHYFFITLQINFMSTRPAFKNYYQILGISECASLFEIENAYEKCAAKWHPDKHKKHRKTAECRFQEICMAYQILSDRNKRAHYDELLKEYSLQDANSTFDRFFNMYGCMDDSEQKMCKKICPNSMMNYYSVLGLPRTASCEDIKNAYRKLAMKYHPKNNPTEDAQKKFIQINEAYNALASEFKRQNYNDMMFGEMAPMRAYNIFEDFFCNRMSCMEGDDEFKPMFQSKWIKKLDNMMIDQDKDVKQGKIIKTSSYWSNTNGKQSGKTVTTKKVIKDGKQNEEITEEYMFPNGEKNIVKIINVDGKVETKKYALKKGEGMPKELTQQAIK